MQELWAALTKHHIHKKSYPLAAAKKPVTLKEYLSRAFGINGLIIAEAPFCCRLENPASAKICQNRKLGRELWAPIVFIGDYG